MTVKVKVFQPRYGNGQTVSPTTTTATVTLRASNKQDDIVVLTNIGTLPVYVRTGVSGVVATTADYPVLQGSQVALTMDKDHTHIATITASGTGSLHVITGEGM